MLSRLRGAWKPSRRMVLVVVPAVLGVLLLVTADRSSTGISRLEATRGAVPDLLAGGEDATTRPAGVASTPTTRAAESTAIALAIPTDPAAPAPAGPGPSTTAPVTTMTAPPATGSGSGTGGATSDSASAPTATSGETRNPVAAASDTTTTTAAPRIETTTTVPARGGPVRTPSVESAVVPLTNQDRSANGLGTLSRNSCLDSVASGYAEQLANSGVLAHNQAAGGAVRGCRPNAAWGDNVGTATPCSASLLEEKWMASPSHRHNILTGEFTYIGVGAWTDAAGACWVQVLFSS